MTDAELAATAHELRMSAVRLVRRLRRERDAEGLAYPLLNALGWLEREGPLTNADLAAIERVTPQTMMRTTADLAAEGLISRTDNPVDRRQVLLAVTPAGRKLILADRERRESFLANAMKTTLTPTERDLLRLAADLMNRLAAIEESAPPAPSPTPEAALAPISEPAPATAPARERGRGGRGEPDGARA